MNQGHSSRSDRERLGLGYAPPLIPMTDCHGFKIVDPLDLMTPDEAREFEARVLDLIRGALHYGGFGGRTVESVELEGSPGRGQVVFRYTDEVFGGPFEARGEVWIPGGTIEVVHGEPFVNPPEHVGGWVLAGFRAWDFPARELKENNEDEEHA